MFLKKVRVGTVIERFGSKTKHKYKLTENAIQIVPQNTEIIPVHYIDNFKVYDNTGKEEIFPIGNFYITKETIDPYHILIDMF